MVFQVVVFHTRTPPLFIAYQLVRIPGSTSGIEPAPEQFDLRMRVSGFACQIEFFHKI